jgi:hypothetical protein
MKKRVRHHYVGNADKQVKALEQGKPVPQYFERCDRCGKIVRAVQTPKERRRYCPANSVIDIKPTSNIVKHESLSEVVDRKNS